MKIPKPKAAEYLGVHKDYLGKLILAGKLKNADHYHITLDSLIDHQIANRTRTKTIKPRIGVTIKSMRIKGDTKLIIEFPSRKGILYFMDKIAEYVNISITGRKYD